ncbi:Os03g0415800 [Oryza sativa Japonica Group]|uniref:Mitochondrial import inner membrane translocase subunit Tim17 family protein n=2 Tax=Oryza sativa subsp. japonica TaxID=39947 RepID=Q75IW4_ORYSJ|nr:putative inner mitochondrial membrane translocase [Oryza sativa Japonica Group]ABF96615.1 Mitochondrial import inner membrane translocase subunit Tim17 family protein [Oryza sativa Japonica Group]BAS84700.1 Os03g0415800 [Oryza sativa Japonica Group]
MEEEWGVPYPDCVLDNAGAGFVGGAAAGTLAHLFTGLRDFPCGRHLAGAAQAVRDGAPCLATRWAARLAVYSAACHALSSATDRHDDPLVSVAAGAATGAVARLRHGPLAVGRAALVGAATLAAVELMIRDSVEEHDDDKPRRNQRPLPAKTKEDDVILRITPAIDHFPVPDPFIAASRGSLLRFRG